MCKLEYWFVLANNSFNAYIYHLSTLSPLSQHTKLITFVKNYNLF